MIWAQDLAGPMNRFRRTMLLVIIIMALLGTLLGWIIMHQRGLGSLVGDTVQGGSLGVLLVLLLATWWRWVPQRVVEMGALVFAVLVCLACMVLRMYWPHYAANIDLEPLYLWFPALYVFAFMLTNHKIGLWVSLAILVLFLLVSLPYLLLHFDGEEANITVQMHVVSAALIATLYFYSGYRERLHRAQLHMDQLARLSNTDALTGLANRRGMTTRIEAALAAPAREHSGLALMLFDIDNFKQINDQHGHAAGDAALLALAGHASDWLGGRGVLGRWGGDEFVALLHTHGAEAALREAGALCAHVAAMPLDTARGITITISGGVTSANPGDGIDTLLQRADAALYAAKHGGRNRVEMVLAAG